MIFVKDIIPLMSVMTFASLSPPLIHITPWEQQQ